MGEHARLYASESFLYNVEISTGNRKLLSQVSMQNNILFSYSPNTEGGRYAVGYGLGKITYSIDPERDYQFYHYDAQVSYVGENLKFSNSGQMVTKLRGFVGRRLFMQKPYYVFVGLSLNYGFKLSKSPINPPRIHLEIDERNSLWPGFALGIQLH